MTTTPAPGADLATDERVLSKGEVHTLRRLIECAEVLNTRPRPMCRDCADENGTCPNSGLECDMRKLLADVKALHNKLASPAAAPAPVSGMPEEMLTLAEVWAAAGGNPGINPTRQDVLDALKIMDEAVDECDAKHSAKAVSGTPDLAKLIEYERNARGSDGGPPYPVETFYLAADVQALLALPAPQVPASNEVSGMPDKWMPNPANVNALPPGLREYVHDLQTLCDPQYLVQQVTFLTDQCDMLQRALVLARKPDVDVEAERPSFESGAAPLGYFRNVHANLPYGDYVEPATQSRWEGWQERANFAATPPASALCPKCGGEGVIHTGIEESPTTQCGKCDGTGLAPLPAPQAPDTPNHTGDTK